MKIEISDNGKAIITSTFERRNKVDAIKLFDRISEETKSLEFSRDEIEKKIKKNKKMISLMEDNKNFKKLYKKSKKDNDLLETVEENNEVIEEILDVEETQEKEEENIDVLEEKIDEEK